MTDKKKGSEKGSKLNLNKETLGDLTPAAEGEGVVGGKGTLTAASCSDPCPATKLLCPHKTEITGGCPKLPPIKL
jgi:hypothetical protein